MKKKTVVTTEKREIWIIRQPAGEEWEYEAEVTDNNPNTNSIPALLDQNEEADSSIPQGINTHRRS